MKIASPVDQESTIIPLGKEGKSDRIAQFLRNVRRANLPQPIATLASDLQEDASSDPRLFRHTPMRNDGRAESRLANPSA
jgi:hypothetical protein